MNEYRALLNRLKAAQRELLAAAARSGGVPSENALRKIADLEVAIGAVETLIDEAN